MLLICADVVRPSTRWLLTTKTPKNLAASMARTRDPQAFAALGEQCRGVTSTGVVYGE